MSEPPTLPFLARPGYRRRRLIEAIRLLPYIGLLLLIFPLLWPDTQSAPRLTSHVATFLFAGWFVLILATGAAIRALRRADRQAQSDRALSEDDPR